MLQFGFSGHWSGIFGADPWKIPRKRKIRCNLVQLELRRSHICLSIAALLIFSGCDPTKRVPEGRYLLKRNTVKVAERSVDTEDLIDIIKQKPNKKILGLRFYLTAYNLPDPERIAAKKERKDQRRDAKNEQRVEDGKPPKPYSRTTGEWLRDVVGEPPVILDSSLTARSNQQIRAYMQREGYFNAIVNDTVHYTHRKLFGGRGKPYNRPKAEVVYFVEPGPMYRYRYIKHDIDDLRMRGYVLSDTSNALIEQGQRFDVDELDAERTRITKQLREEGYLFFTKELIHYDADTTVGDLQVDIELHFERLVSGPDKGLAGTPEGTVYTIGDITVGTQRYSRRNAGLIPDTLTYQNYDILYTNKLRYNPNALLTEVYLEPHSRFRQSNADRTYRRLSGLRVFDRIDITYDTTRAAGPGLANARIDAQPGKEQSVSAEASGTNRGGFFGVSGSLAYKHRNLFKGMGSAQLQLVLGLEAQQSFNSAGTGAQQGTTGGVVNEGLFNTVDIGPELNIRFPKFLQPFWFIRPPRSTAPSTTINILYNYQKRPDYGRTLAKFSYGFEWQESRYNTVGFFPLEINVIKIPEKSEAFQTYLQQANDPVLTDSYTDHLIVGMRGQFTHNTQTSSKARNSFFARITGEWAAPLGFMGSAAQDTAGNTFNTVSGIRYAEFVKLDSDLRWRHVIHEKSSLAFRIAAGIGMPYGNLTVLPFESSFFVGGANGLRAWRARSIGPGSYSAPLLAYDRIGEIRLEGNAEYRFKLIGIIEGALFTDIGNIWELEEDPKRPGGGFSDTFLSELAIGTGAGIRLNFDFFIVRVDLGLQTKDPSLPSGERWLFQPKDRYLAQLEDLNLPVTRYRNQYNFNLGIGYPF